MARSQVASDSFTTYSNGNLQTVSGGNWTHIHDTLDGVINVLNNTIVPSAIGGTSKAARWTGAGTFSNNQYSKLAITVTSLTSDYRIGVICRASADTATARDFYYLEISDDGDPSRTTVLGKVVNGTVTPLHSATVNWTSGDTVEIEAEGTTIRGMKNGVALGGSYTQTDSSLETGKPGVIMNGDTNVPVGDNWEGGDVSATTPITVTLPVDPLAGGELV